MNIQEIKTKFKAEKSADAKKSLVMLQYIEDLASKTGTSIYDWDATIFLKDGYVTHTKPMTNKIFFERKEQRQEHVAREVTDLGGALKDALNKFNGERQQKALKAITTKRDECLKEAERLQNDAAEQIKQAWTRTRDLQMMGGAGGGITFGDQIMDLLADGLLTFESFDGTILRLSTQDIINTEVNPTAGLDLRVNLGQFIIEVNIQTMRLYVRQFKNNIIVSGHYHPHVNSSGDVCQGNTAAAYGQLSSEAKIKELLQLVVTLLQTYNPGNPYARLADFAAKDTRKEGKLRETEAKADTTVGSGGTPYVIEEDEDDYEEGEEEFDCAECEDALDGCEECR